MLREIRRGGEFGFDADRVQFGKGAERTVPQRPLLNLRRESGAAATLLEVDKDGMAALDLDTGVAVVGEAERLLSDVPLIVEDLLTHAQQLADSRASTQAVQAILDHVAALREGRS